MIIIKDSMVIIHLAKITLLEKSCEYFGNVMIPRKVYKEATSLEQESYPEIGIIKDLVDKKKIAVKDVRDRKLLDKVNEFNIQRDEAEAVSLYWEEKANYLATDDNNVRKKNILLGIKVLGTPVIILKLYRERKIDKSKFDESISELRKIGWFSNIVLDKLLMEAR
jgi:predicted nucleic acid-binding protein